jgi:hypothetical protein
MCLFNFGREFWGKHMFYHYEYHLKFSKGRRHSRTSILSCFLIKLEKLEFTALSSKNNYCFLKKIGEELFVKKRGNLDTSLSVQPELQTNQR